MYAITIFLLVSLGLSIWRDNRSLLNPVLLIFSLIFSYFALARLFNQTGLTVGNNLLLLSAFVVLPTIIFF